MCITTFAVLLKILNNETQLETYDDTGLFAFFLMAFRTSIGDNEMGDFLINKNNKLLAWFIWLVIMILGNIIFMNFIIAVVSESYENCMS